MRTKLLRAGLCAVLLASCASPDEGRTPPKRTVSDAPAAPMQQITADSPTASAPTAQIIRGSGALVHPESARNHGDVTAEGDVVLNFVNTDIREVARTVFGDILKLNYVVAPNVQGTVTLKTNRPLPKDAAMAALNEAFHLSGVAIIEGGGMVRVVPEAEAPRQRASLAVSSQVRAMPGFGVQVVSLRYIGAEEMQRVLQPISPAGGIALVDSYRNIIMLTGSEEERQSMMDAIDSFDVDWLAGMSFGLFPLKAANTKTVISELWDVLGTQTGPLGKMVRLVPLPQLNAVLAISAQPAYLDKIKSWIEKLDYEQASSGQKVWVYAVQNGRASQLAETLNKLIGAPDAGGGSNTGSSPGSNGAQAPQPPRAVVQPALQNGVFGQGDDQNGLPASQGLRLIADESTNSLIVMGTAAHFSIIEAALKKLDVVPLQVKIEAVIAEVTLTNDLNYGVQYLFNKGSSTVVQTQSKTVSVGPSLPGFSYFVTDSKISAVLDLLQSVTDVHVISSPQLMVLNNQTATLQVGAQVPVATQSAVGVLTTGAPIVNTIQMLDTGVILRVTPRVNASGLVILDISQEVSDVTPTTSSTLDSPTINQRKITSSVAVRDGETIALGGLITDTVTNGTSGVPFLSTLPYVGALFGSTNVSHDRTELLALITPRVVRNDHEVREATEEMRQQMKAVIPLDGQLR